MTQKKDRWDVLSEHITFNIVFVPPALYNECEYVECTLDLAEEIFLSKQVISFWEDQVLHNHQKKLINESGHLHNPAIEQIIQSFECFEKYIITFPKNIPFSKIEPFSLISDFSTCALFDFCIGNLHYICKGMLALSKIQFTLGLGHEIDLLFKQVQKFYYSEGRLFQNSESFERKFNILREMYYLDIRCVWFRQIEFLSEYLKSTFKQHLLNINPDHRLEQTSNSIVRVMDKKFDLLIQTIIPSYNKGSWNSTYYRDIFRKSIRALLETKIRNAYYKGYLVKREKKQPISIWFHALFPHPFGKDSNAESFDPEDSYVYEEKKERIETKANLMRYIIQKPRFELNNNKRNKKIVNNMKNEDFIFKEKPKKAVQRTATN
mmetsp:Transcript_60036/g.147630  ORF Transcript_60036/g.147630 Transcript_60036/m.147630 type:complete len:378 (-) Transcript_60036:1518-2651(-)